MGSQQLNLRRDICADIAKLTVSHGGTLTIDKRDNYDATYFFCVGSHDPWVGKLLSRSIVPIHADWIREAVKEGFPIPIGAYILDDLYEPADGCHECQCDSVSLASFQNCRCAQASDSTSDASIQEVGELLIPDADHAPVTQSSNDDLLDHVTGSRPAHSSIFGTPACSSFNGRLYKRPRLSADSDQGQERNTFKKARFLTPTSLRIRDVSSATPCSEQSTHAPYSVATHPISLGSYYDPSMFHSPPLGSPNKSSLHLLDQFTASSSSCEAAPTCYEAEQSIEDATLSTSATTYADQSDSTLVDSSSNVQALLNSLSTSKPLPKPHAASKNSAQVSFWNRWAGLHHSSTSPLHILQQMAKLQPSNTLISPPKQFRPKTMPSPRQKLLTASIHSSPNIDSGPLRISIEDFLRCTTSPPNAMHTTTNSFNTGAALFEGVDLDEEADATLFEAGKMYLGRKMRYLGTS